MLERQNCKSNYGWHVCQGSNSAVSKYLVNTFKQQGEHFSHWRSWHPAKENLLGGPEKKTFSVTACIHFRSHSDLGKRKWIRQQTPISITFLMNFSSIYLLVCAVTSAVLNTFQVPTDSSVQMVTCLIVNQDWRLCLTDRRVKLRVKGREQVVMNTAILWSSSVMTSRHSFLPKMSEVRAKHRWKWQLLNKVARHVSEQKRTCDCFLDDKNREAEKQLLSPAIGVLNERPTAY